MFLSHLRAVARQKRPAADRLTVVLKGEGGTGEEGEVAGGGGGAFMSNWQCRVIVKIISEGTKS